jgi:SpoVK/Ycf46/Vps4 family AAA+-type ATPase
MSEIAVYLKLAHKFQAIPSAETVKKLPPGMYSIKYNPRTEMVVFGQSKTTHDELVDLPGTAYDQVMSEFEYFMTQECSDRHSKVGLLHKMNILLYGNPGTGKTCIVNRVAHRTVAEGGIVLFNPNPASLKEVFRILDKLQPETRVLVIFEELDQLINSHGEDPFLHVLDGEVQKSNAMFIATTNYISKVPPRIRRPGRFAVRVEVGYPSFEARKHYCFTKLGDEALSAEIAGITQNFSIDQLKEVIRSHYCMKKELQGVVVELRKEFQITETGSPSFPESNENEWDGDFEDDEDLPKFQLGFSREKMK